jgi:hypothetical protein
MRPRICSVWPALAALLCAAACTSFESEYEKGVYDYEPLYCYQTLGGVDCHRKPHQRDAARLVNYYGPAPGKYKPPKPPKESALRAPAKAPTMDEHPEPKTAASTSAVDAGDAGETSRAAATEEKSEWKEWLPLVSLAFGALQVVAAFAL